MKSFFFICLTNCLDFGILEKYLKCFSQERKVDRYKREYETFSVK